MSLTKTVKSFCTSNGKQTVKALALTLAVVDEALNSGNTDPMGILATRTDPKMRAQVRAIIRQVLGGYEMRVNKKHFTGLKWVIVENAGPTDKMRELRKLVEEGASIYSDGVKTMINGEPAPKVQLTTEQFAEKLEAYAKRAGFTVDVRSIALIETDNDEMPIAA